MYKKTFHGGVHPYDGKEFARDIPFQTWLPKGDLVFHLNQHIGKPAKPLVQKGDSVLAGQIIAEADGFVSANIISSVSGTVKAIEKRENVLGTTDLSIVVANDGQYTLAEGVGAEVDPTTLTDTGDSGKSQSSRHRRTWRSRISNSCKAGTKGSGGDQICDCQRC